MPHLLHGIPMLIGTISWQARILSLMLGIGLCLWTLTKLRNRALLISICSLFIAVGLSLIAFSLVPNYFDMLAYAVGIQYPPLGYLIGAIVLLMIIILVLAGKVSVVDERCRRLAQELALLRRTEPETNRK